MKRFIVSVMALLLALAGLVQAQQNAISVSFLWYGDGDGWNYHDRLPGAEVVAGYVPAANWNQFLDPPGATEQGPLVDSSGTATPVKFTVDKDFSWGNYYLNIDSETEGLLTPWQLNTLRVNYSFIGCNGGAANRPLVAIKNILYAKYDVIVYLTIDVNGRRASASMAGTTYYYRTEWLGDFWTPMPADIIQYGGKDEYASMKTRMYKANQGEDEMIWHPATNTTAGDYTQSANVVIFKGLTGSTQQLLFSCLDNCGIGGFQIVDATMASDPVPANGAIDVPVNTNLSWTAPSGYVPSSYKVYLGTDPNTISQLNGTLTGTTMDPAANLAFFTAYYWQVSSVDPNNGNPTEFKSPVWTFKTAPALPVVNAAYPADVLVRSGEQATLTALATNPSTGDETNIAYNWYKVNTAGGNDAFLGTGKSWIIASAALADEGSYYFKAVITTTQASATSRQAALNTRRLINHWKFDGDLTDSIAGKNGSPTGNDPNYSDGVAGKALNLPQTANSITLPTDSYTSYSWTLSFWEKAAAGSGEWQSVIASGATDGYENLELNRHGPDQYAHGVHGSYQYPTGQAPREQWQHVLVSFDGAAKAWKWYLNGRYVTKGTGVSYNGFDTVFYVGNTRNGGQQYVGAIDDIRFYNYALDAYEAAAVYTQIKPNDVICVEAIALDLNGDCRIDVNDLALLLSGWMNCNIVPDCR